MAKDMNNKGATHLLLELHSFLFQKNIPSAEIPFVDNFIMLIFV